MREIPLIRPAKIGTIPYLVQVHKTDLKTIAVGKYVRIKRPNHDRYWVKVLVRIVDDRVQPGWFQGDFM